MTRQQMIVAVGCVACCILFPLTACVAGELSPTITPIEKVLGAGWTCYAAPDAFKKAGIVIEVTADGKYLFDGDYSAKVEEGPSAIGTARVSSTTTLGGVLQLLKSFHVFVKDAKATADLSRKVVIEATYGGTRKQVINGQDVRDIANIYSNMKLTPTSHYFVFRESQSATSVDILLDGSIVASLGATAALNGLLDVNSAISKDNANQYRLKDKYEKPIGICTVATELLIQRNFTGQTIVTPGEEYPVPDSAIVEHKGS